MDKYKLKQITEKIVNCFIYDLLTFITMLIAFTALFYRYFCDDFMCKKTLYIIYLVLIALASISRVIKAIIVKGEKRITELICCVIFSFTFLSEFLQFIGAF